VTVALRGREGRFKPLSSDRQSAVGASLAEPHLDFLQRHAAALSVPLRIFFFQISRDKGPRRRDISLFGGATT
jgi:hypothetical protein